MRITHLLAAAAVVGAALPAHAQSGTVSIRRTEAGQETHRAALGVGTTTTGTLRDTLGLMITSITPNSPAEKAGLEEGNRLSAINSVSLRTAAADVEDGEMSGAVARRLTRELGKVKAGDEIELRVYRDGRTQSMRIRTADADTLFRRTASATFTRTSREEIDARPALGFGIGSSGSRRDTLGVLIMSVTDSSPAARAGLEEGNRIAAINGVNLRVSREDSEDRALGGVKASRLQREISKLKVGDNVALRVYSNGQFRDMTLKAVRVGDLPRRSSYTYFGDMMPAMAPMPPMSPMSPMTPMTPMTPMAPAAPMALRMNITPQIRQSLERARVELQRVRPQFQMELDRMRPQLERLRAAPATRIRMVRVEV